MSLQIAVKYCVSGVAIPDLSTTLTAWTEHQWKYRAAREMMNWYMVRSPGDVLILGAAIGGMELVLL